MSTLPKTPYLISTIAPKLAAHDGDDRRGFLSTALLDLLKTRESSDDAEAFVRGFDAVMASLEEAL